MSVQIMLKEVRLSFPDIFEAVQYQGQGAFRYNATALVVPGSENDKIIRAAISKAAQEEWKDRASTVLLDIKDNANKFCYIDGNRKSYDGYQGVWALSGHRRKQDGRIKIRDRDGKTDLVAADGRPYGGCYVNMWGDIWAQSGQNSGMRFGLTAIQFVKDGDAFSGAGSVSDDVFDDLSDQDEAPGAAAGGTAVGGRLF